MYGYTSEKWLTRQNNHICWTQIYSDFQNQFSSFHTTTQCYAPSSTTAPYF